MDQTQEPEILRITSRSPQLKGPLIWPDLVHKALGNLSSYRITYQVPSLSSSPGSQNKLRFFQFVVSSLLTLRSQYKRLTLVVWAPYN